MDIIEIEEIQEAPKARVLTRALEIIARHSLAISILFGVGALCLSILYASHTLSGKLTENTEALHTVSSRLAVPNQPTTGTVPTGPVDIKLKDSAPFLGNKDANVVLVEYADFQCPFCHEFFKTILPDLRTKYIDTGKVKFVFQDFAFLGDESKHTAEAAKCAGDQNKFWQYHDYLYEHQGQENSGAFSDDNLKKFAQAIQLDSRVFNQCLDSHIQKPLVEDEINAGTSYGVTGTPSLFINGNKHEGVANFSVYEQAIEEALKK